ncbi:MAG: helix-turn-helix transcriptional regulator [Baekduia sp.]
MPTTGEIVRATGLCSMCDFKFREEVVARYPARSMPGGWAYIELRHLDADAIEALDGISVERASPPYVHHGDVDPLTCFAANVRRRRKELELTQEVAGDRGDMEASYWSRIERGSIDPGVRMVVRVAKALETTAANLLDNVS